MVTVEEGILNRSATDIWVIYTAIEFSIALSGAILSKKMADMLIILDYQNLVFIFHMLRPFIRIAAHSHYYPQEEE